MLNCKISVMGGEREGDHLLNSINMIFAKLPRIIGNTN